MSEKEKTNDLPEVQNESFSGAELLKKSFADASKLRPTQSQSGNNNNQNSKNNDNK